MLASTSHTMYNSVEQEHQQHHNHQGDSAEFSTFGNHPNNNKTLLSSSSAFGVPPQYSSSFSTSMSAFKRSSTTMSESSSLDLQDLDESLRNDVVVVAMRYSSSSSSCHYRPSAPTPDHPRNSLRLALSPMPNYVFNPIKETSI